MAEETPNAGATPPNRRAALIATGAVVALLLLVGAIVVATKGDDDGDTGADVATAGTDTTTTTTGAAGGEGGPSTTVAGDTTTNSATGAPASPAPTESGGASTQDTTPEAGADLGAAQDPGPASPPVAGTYRYRTVTSDGEEREDPLTIEDISRAEGEVVQSVRGAQGGFDATSEVVWRPDRVLVRSTTFDVQGTTAHCDWEPDLLQAVLPLTAGASWSNDSGCDIEGLGPTPTRVEQQSEVTVVGLERRVIAGEALDLWVVDGTATFSFSGMTIHATTKTWFSPRHGLIVRTEASGQSSGPQSESGSWTSEILELRPR